MTGGGTFASGTQVSLTATPSSGYSFSGWSNGSTTNPLTITLNSNTSITAKLSGDNKQLHTYIKCWRRRECV